MSEQDVDFAISAEVRIVLLELHDEVSKRCAEYAGYLSSAGLPDAQSIGAIAHLLLEASAHLSIRNRIENLDGEPSVDRWRRVGDDIFNRALDNILSTTGASQ